MKKRTIFLYVCVLIAIWSLLLSIAQSGSAQDPQPTPSDDDVNRVAKEMYCPVCESTPLDVCPTQACTEWRELIRLKLSEGYSDEEIKDFFAMQYGDRVLAEPPRRGLNWLVYLLPVAGFAVGAVVVWRVLASTKRKSVSAAAGPLAGDADGPASAGKAGAADDPYLARLEEELKKKDT